MKNYFVLKSFLLEVQCMLEVSIVAKADKANIQESVKEQQAFVKVSMKSCIICLGWKIAIKIMILSCGEKPITGSKLLNTQCCCFPLVLITIFLWAEMTFKERGETERLRVKSCW